MSEGSTPNRQMSKNVTRESKKCTLKFPFPFKSSNLVTFFVKVCLPFVKQSDIFASHGLSHLWSLVSWMVLVRILLSSACLLDVRGQSWFAIKGDKKKCDSNSSEEDLSPLKRTPTLKKPGILLNNWWLSLTLQSQNTLVRWILRCTGL